MTNMKRTDARLGKLSGEMRRGFEASEAGNPAEALKIYQGVLEKAQALGLESGFVLWNLAIVADNLGELEMAFDYIRRALAADPLAQPFQNSFDVVVKRIRAALADEARKVDDPSTPRLYDILAGAGEADVGVPRGHGPLVRGGGRLGPCREARRGARDALPGGAAGLALQSRRGPRVG